MHLTLSVVGKDKPGIIAAVTKICYRLGGNLEDASMSILNDQFAMILSVSFPSRNQNKLSLFRKQLGQLEKMLSLTITVQEIKGIKKKSKMESSKLCAYLISIFGKDQAGIVYRVSNLLARYRLNITDLDSKLISGRPKPIYGLLLEVDIPKRFSVEKLKKDLDGLARSLKVDLTFKPVDPITL